MVQANQTSLVGRSIGLSIAAMIAVMAGASRVAQAACTDCTFEGTGAGAAITSGYYETGLGVNALGDDTEGEDNTAAGVDALVSNTTGSENTATGIDALYNNTTGVSNTAAGSGALFSNTTGSENAAAGVEALADNTTGSENAAAGVEALADNTTGNYNTAAGFNALVSNSEGAANTAAGAGALAENTTGGANTATGFNALVDNTSGENNTAAGEEALGSNTTGGSNIAVGYEAGDSLTTGSDNIDIGNSGVEGESNTIRIGTEGTQADTYIAGLANSSKIKKGCALEVETSGLVGCAKSSARYKRDIQNMGDASDNLMKLRPVTFQYRNDPSGTKEYGLIAEEVAKVYPELVIEDADGKPETVEYQVLPAMLLNEVQKQARTYQRLARELDAKDAQIAILQRRVAILEKQNNKVKTISVRLDVLERQVRAANPDRLAALR